LLSDASNISDDFGEERVMISELANVPPWEMRTLSASFT